MNYNGIKLYVTVLLLVSILSCSNDEIDFSSLNETIFVRHLQADMPAYVHGNASEKVFLIYLHGGPGGFGLEARINSMITEVEENNAVIYFDQRGSGNAQGNFPEEAVSVYSMADDVLALVKVLEKRYGSDSKFFLMGASWGGALGSATLLKNQDPFLGWIDVAGTHNPGGLYGEYPSVLEAKALEQIALGNSVSHWESVLETVQQVGSNYSDEDFTKLNQAAHNSEAVLAHDMVINEPQYLDEDGNEREIVVRNHLEVPIILNQNGLFRDLSFTDRLHEITLPSLVLWGKHDLVVPTPFAIEAMERLGSAHKELFIFERSGHSPLEAEPDLFAEKVIEFINEYK